MEVVGSPKELRGAPGYRDGMDLHRPAIDGVRLECPKCGGAMKRVPDVLDVWFDASVASWAQLGYPAKRDDFKRWWPCDWVAEAHDQVKGWLYVQLATSSLVFDRMPYKSALVHGWICAQSGKPMSKSHENAISPADAIDAHGRDALRLYLIGKVPPWKDVRYNPDEVRSASKFLNTLWSVYRFVALYRSMDSHDLGAEPESAQRHLTAEDRWALSRLEALKEKVASEMQAQSPHKALEAIERYVVNDVSRWYLKLVRGRAWAEGAPEDKMALYWTLSEMLVAISKMLAPFAPYLAEEMYQNLDGRLVSVHMCDWPPAVKERRDQRLEEQMEAARRVVVAANQSRQLVGHKLRWPLKRITFEAKDQASAEAVSTFQNAVKNLANAKELEVVQSGHEWAGLEIEVHPNPKAIGKAYKLWEKKIARMLQARPAKKIKQDIEKGVYKLGIEGQMIEILPEMVTFTTKLPSNIVKGDVKEGSVFINVETDEEIRSEGIAREVIRRIQEMRKDIEMDAEDYANVAISAGDEVQPMLEKWEDAILTETRCAELSFGVEAEGEYVVEWPVDGHNVVVGVTPVRMKASVQAFTEVPGIDKAQAVALFTAGYPTLEAVADAPKEEVLRVPGMNHAALRAITDWLATPPDLRAPSDISCPVCDRSVGQGAVECPRCGAGLIPGESSETSDEEVELTSALEETLTEEDDSSNSVAERATKLLEVIADLRKPSKGDEHLLSELAVRLDSTDAPAVKAKEVPAADVKTADERGEARHATLEPAPVKEEEEEEPVTEDMARFIKLVTEEASVSKHVAKSLYMAGYDTVEKLETAIVEDLRNVDKVGKVTARKIIEAFSKKPVTGATQPAETQLCSLCNAIVALDAKKCPRCGTSFEYDDGERETRLIEKTLKTVEAIDKKLTVKPEDSNLLYSKAMTLLEQGSPNEARRILARVLELEPGHDRALEAIARLSAKVDTLIESKAQAEAPSPEELTQAVTPADVKEQQASPDSSHSTPAQAVAPPEDVEQGVDLRDGFTYLLREERSTGAYKLLKRYIESGKKGFCVTRNYPEKVREMYGLGDTPILWLSNVGTKDSVRPKDLEKLSLSLEQFLSKQGGIILLDGLEYLITNNSFITVLRLIQSLRDQVAINRSIFILPVNPDTMSSNELNNLEKEVDLVLS
jgi:hypothetical protein